ncbi:MAG: hypothetical protein ACI4OT_01175 [Bacilli bacterium]
MKTWKDRKKYYLDNNAKTVKSKSRKYFFTKTMKQQTRVMMASVFVVLLVMFGTTYAVFSSINKTEDFNGVNVGDLHIDYQEESGAISLVNSYPISDEEGLKSKAYTFYIQNTGSLASTYSVKLLDDTAVINGEEKTDAEMSEKLLNKNDLKVSVNGNSPVILESLATKDYELLNGKLQPGEKKKISVRVWIKADASNDIFIKNEDGSLTGKYYFGKITVAGENTNTYETDSLLVWYDAINNTSDGHSDTTNSWYDLSGNNNNLDISGFSNYTWNDKFLDTKLTNATNTGFSYDTSSMEVYTVSTSFKVLSSSGDINILETGDVNIHLVNGVLKIGDLVDEYTIENNKSYTITIIKRKKVVVENNVKGEEVIKEIYINGEFYKDITNVNKTEVVGGNIDINIKNYLVYSKALTVNKENNNYRLTVERYGE